ncbi:ABC transporter [Streptosporangium sp. NPDC023615]|uniref:ABC transporter n=1 Tax=Streptosporangium sp. NPDC023615 TaxID=3154794 RepID=UPI003421766F
MSPDETGDPGGSGETAGAGTSGTTGRTRETRGTGDVSRATGAPRFGDVLAAELIKIRTLPAVWIALAVASAANLALAVLATTDVVKVAGQDGPIAIGQVGTLMLSPVYVLVAIAVHAAGGEYRTGQLRVSLAAVPGRNRLHAAKLAATTTALLLAAVPAILPGHLVRYVPEVTGGRLGAGAAARDLAALLGVCLLLALIGHGLAVVARSVVLPLAVLVVTPVLVSPLLRGSLPDLVRLLPHEGALALLGTADDPGTSLGRTGGLLTLALWAALSAGCAWTALTRRDA